MRHTVSVDEMIGYLKKWCVKPVSQEDQQPGEDSEGSEFTSTVQHIHNVYTYLSKNCSQYSLKELFTHTPAVFVEHSKYGTNWPIST